jgi:hypothetical protein
MSLWFRRDFVGEYVHQPGRLIDLKLPEERPKNLAALAGVRQRVLIMLGESAVLPRQPVNGDESGRDHPTMFRILGPSTEIRVKGKRPAPPDPEIAGPAETAEPDNIVYLRQEQ